MIAVSRESWLRPGKQVSVVFCLVSSLFSQSHSSQLVAHTFPPSLPSTGTAAPAIDVTSGQMINPHNPEFITKKPWYLGGDRLVCVSWWLLVGM